MRRSIIAALMLALMLPVYPALSFQKDKDSFNSVLEAAIAEAVPEPIIAIDESDTADPEGGCLVSTVILNSGFDHNASAVYPVNFPDARWTVLVDTDPATAEPRPASTIIKHNAWRPAEPNTQWIGTYPGNAQLVNGAYIFETVFCLTGDAEQVVLEIGMRADDQCMAFVNESLTKIANGTAAPIFVGQSFNATSLNVQQINLTNLQAGKNRLTIRVDNTGSTAMGLNVVASIIATPGGTAERPECCCATGVIQGRKYNDLNANGQRDPGEPYMAGWTINLNSLDVFGHNDSVVTDSGGYFNFVGVPAGDYKLSEIQQPGWFQTEPATNCYILSVNPMQSFTGIEFGNHEADCFFIDPNDNIFVAGICPANGGPFVFRYTFTLTNTGPYPAYAAYLNGPGVHTPNTFDLFELNGNQFLFPGQSIQLTTDISGLNPGQDVCLELTIEAENNEVCTREVCFVVPDCVMLGDLDLNGSVNLLDVDPFIDLIAVGGFQEEGDCNQDGTINLLDIEPFIEILSGN